MQTHSHLTDHSLIPQAHAIIQLHIESTRQHTWGVGGGPDVGAESERGETAKYLKPDRTHCDEAF